MYVPLVTYSVHVISLFDLLSIQRIFWWLILYNFTVYFVYLLLLVELSFYMGDILWLSWPILYKYVLLVTYPCWPIFNKYNLFWPSLYTGVIYGQHCLFTSPWCAYLYMKCILWLHVHGPLMNYSVHLLTSSVHFLLGWSVHIPPHVDVFSVITTSSWRICTVMKLFANFVYLCLIG